jgi:hypothetical protein
MIFRGLCMLSHMTLKLTNSPKHIAEHGESKRLQAKTNISINNSVLKREKSPLINIPKLKQSLPPCSGPLVSIAEGRGIWIQCRMIRMASCSVMRPQTKLKKKKKKRGDCEGSKEESELVKKQTTSQFPKKLIELLGLLVKLCAPHLRPSKSFTCLVRSHLS